MGPQPFRRTWANLTQDRHKARQDKTSQDKTRQDETRQDRTSPTQDKTRQDKIGARRHQTKLGTSGSMSPIFIADPIALAKPLPSGAGAVMWCASHVAPYPATCSTIFFLSSDWRRARQERKEGGRLEHNEQPNRKHRH